MCNMYEKGCILVIVMVFVREKESDLPVSAGIDCSHEIPEPRRSLPTETLPVWCQLVDRAKSFGPNSAFVQSCSILIYLP
jgi:hypothetical protein